MRNNAILIIFIILLVAGLGVCAYLAAANQESGFLILKAAIFYIIALLIFICWLTINSHKFTAAIPAKYNNLERLLLDVRDNKKTFYTEKRQDARLQGEISARMSSKYFEGVVKVVNIGYKGVLLRCPSDIAPDTAVEVTIHLPLFPQPIDVKARVIRSVPHHSPGENPAFDIALEYTAISNIDREKLIETLDILLEKQAGA